MTRHRPTKRPTSPADVFNAMYLIPERSRSRTGFWERPARIMAAGIAILIAIGTALLMLPAATTAPGGTSLLTALFTSTSATCVTGLVVVDTGTYWTTFGHVVIFFLMQVGGLGVMASASLLAVLIAGRMGIRSRLVAEYETGIVGASTVRRVLFGTLSVALVVELVVFAVLAGRLWLTERLPPGEALWYGAFHSVSAFNSGGFAFWPDSLISFANDPWIVIPIMVAFVVGGLGFLVVFELTRVRPARNWTIHTKITLLVSGILMVVGPLVITLNEWANPATLGALDPAARVLSGIFSGLTPRSAGFTTIDFAQADPATLFFTNALMFIGGGSGSTAGGIKVTTFAILAMAVVAEARGHADVDVLGRRLSSATVRQAIAVVTVAVALMIVSTLLLLRISELPLDDVLFEVISALGTVGLSTGITGALPDAGQYLVVVLMFLGRIGSIALVTALALRTQNRAYRNPEGRPIVG